MENGTDLSFYPGKSSRRQAPSNIHSLERSGRWKKPGIQEVEHAEAQRPKKNLKVMP
jgi:hypothetical protein